MNAKGSSFKNAVQEALQEYDQLPDWIKNTEYDY